MLSTYHSNQLEQLAEVLIGVVRQPLSNPLIPEIILVQSSGMARWLAMLLAERLSVCTNVRFPFPEIFLNEIANSMLTSSSALPQQDAAILSWQILRQFSDLEHENYTPLKHYLNQADDLSRYQLAHHLAVCYQQYALYRPEWLNHWQRGEEDHWQALLWQQLGTEIHAHHHSAYYQQLLHTLKTLEQSPTTWPQRIALVGISALPPLHLELLAQLGNWIDVHLLLLNPCREYWGDIRAERDIARLGVDVDPAELYLEVGHPLLASLGKQGRDFIDLLQQQPCVEIEAFVDPFVDQQQDHLLARLQSDILNLRRRGEADCPPYALSPQDHSVQIHACHSPLREVQVLHDQLLALFEMHSDLQPADIIVMTPDIESYSPIVESIFASADSARWIPFSIADRGLRHENQLVDAFLQLLELPDSRFDAQRLLTLLEVSAIRRRFELNDAQLQEIQNWVIDSGIRWGRDGDSKRQWNLPDTEEHTWRMGLERLLLGFALPAEQQRLWNQLSGYDDVEGHQALVLGRLISFAEATFRLHDLAQTPRPPEHWRSELSKVLDDFFDPLDSDQDALQQLRSALNQVAEQALQAQFTEPSAFGLFKAALVNALAVSARPAGFFSGGVTFCTMVPMRSIPFKVVCLIGMNSDQYPRQQQRIDFDLMHGAFRKGDRSRRLDDRYLFLEALISARLCFYLSYIGNHIRDNSVLPPSVLVSELIDVIDRSCTGRNPTASAQLLTRHPLQGFSPRYFNAKEPQLFSYSQEHAVISQRQHGNIPTPKPFITAALSSPEEQWRTLSPEQLLQFFRNPARYLLRERLGIRLDSPAVEFDNSEPFTLNQLQLYQLRQRLLQLQQNKIKSSTALSLLRNDGLLPHGLIGEQWFAREWDKVFIFYQRLRRFLPSSYVEPLAVDFRSEELRLSGWLEPLAAQGLADYRLASIKANDYLRFWLRHVLLNAMAPEHAQHQSRWLELNGEHTLPTLSDSRATLHTLLELYWKGLHQPLAFFPETSLSYVQASRNPKARNPALDTARKTWLNKEHQEPYMQLTFAEIEPLDEHFIEFSELIYAPLFEHLVSS